jgi:hypothetical protein
MNATASTRKLRAPRWPAGLVPWRKAVQSFIERLAQAAKVQIQISGTRTAQSGEQITMTEGIGNGTATSNAVALDRWPKGLRSWKDAVDANLSKISAALHLSTESMQAIARITVDAAALHPSSFNFHPSAWRDWCKDTERTIEALSRATQRQLQLPGMRRASGGDELVFERELPPREITLELELQYRWCEVFYCTLGIVSDVAYTTRQEVVNFENGTITSDYTQPDPGPHTSTESETAHTCATPDVIDDEEAGFEYGDLVSTDPPTYGGPLDPSGLLAIAKAGLEDSGAPYIGASEVWMSNTAPPTSFTQSLGLWGDSGSPATNRKAESYRYRWKATGAALDLTWNQGGDSHSTTVAKGGTSDWYDDLIPATIYTPDAVTDVVIELA